MAIPKLIDLNGLSTFYNHIKAKIAAKYSLPDGGIPKGDLASAVQTSLGKADTALQTHQVLKTVNGQTLVGTGDIVVDTSSVAGAVEDWLDAHPDATTTVADGSITSLKLASDLISIIGGETSDLHVASTDTIGAYWNKNFEEVIETGSTKYWKHTALIDVEGMSQIRWTGGNSPSSNKFNWFVAADNTAVSRFDMATTGIIDVPENAKYVTFTTAKADKIPIYGIYRGNIYQAIDEAQSSVDGIEAGVDRLNDIEEHGYYNLLNQNWTRGGWYAWDDFRTSLYKNRAAINNHVHFDRDTQILCKRGFQILGAAKINGETVSSTGTFSCMFFIPAGADANITVRRINEDDTEVLTDEQVQEFADAVMITSVRGSDYQRYRDTFSGLEMFETMGIIGDSYSAGNNKNNWGKCLGRMIGTQVTVWAQSGQSSAEWITTYLPQLLAADPLELYWLNLGINDGSRVVSDSSYLGSAADVDETTYPNVDDFPDTFWGNYGRIIRNIQKHAPSAKIVMEKTLFASSRNAQTDLPTTATLTINNAIKAIADHYGIPCIDQLDDAFYTSREYALSMNENHPRKYTWPGMANANRRLFTKAVLDNPEYFWT